MEEHKHQIKRCDAQVCRVMIMTEDRAEITRTFELAGSAVSLPGSHRITLKGLSEKVIEDSVRVKGLGNFVIDEVSTERQMATVEEALDQEEVKALLKKAEGLLIAIDSRSSEEETTKRRGELMDSYVESMLTGTVRSKSSPKECHQSGLPAASMQEGGPKSVEAILDFHSSRAVELRSKQLTLRLAREKLEAELAVVEDKLRALLPSGVPKRAQLLHDVRLTLDKMDREALKGTTTVTQTEISILISLDEEAVAKQKAAADSSLSFEVTYLVYGASWNPFYDWRIATGDSKVSLSYFANVSQRTGEDWNNVEIFLSTAKPSVGGSPPHLSTKIANFHEIRLAAEETDFLDGHRQAPVMGMLFGAAPSNRAMTKNVRLKAETRQAAVASPSGSSNVVFRVQRRCTIKSGQAAQKVTVGMIDLEAKFRHYAVPSLSTNVYLQARVVNSSEMTFLPSSSCSIFLDGTFLAKTSIGSVAPGEAFSTSLGVDASVRLENHSEKKHKKEEGFVSKTRKTEYRYSSVFYNTKPSQPIKLLVAQQLPLSQDDKIKVKTLIPPSDNSLITVSSINDASALEEVPNLNEDLPVPVFILNKKTNNMMWYGKIPPTKKTTVEYAYTVEAPPDREIDFTE